MDCLNIPLRHKEFIETEMKTKVAKLNKLLDKIAKIKDKQTQFQIINKFNNINKINYMIRNTSYRSDYQWIREIDKIETRKRNILFGTGLNENQINQTQLAIRKGELALRKASTFYSAANLASKAENIDLMTPLITPEIQTQTDEHIQKPIQQATKDYNKQVLEKDQINNIYEFYKEKKKKK